MIQPYALYNRITLDPKTQTDSKWKDGKIYVMQIIIKTEPDKITLNQKGYKRQRRALYINNYTLM